jgi:hypothetical protein
MVGGLRIKVKGERIKAMALTHQLIAHSSWLIEKDKDYWTED